MHSTFGEEDGTKTSTAQEKADTLNDLFVNVFTRVNKASIHVPQNRRIDESLVTIVFTPNMVRQKLKNLNSAKSPGRDAIFVGNLQILSAFLYLSSSTNRLKKELIKVG